MRVPDSLAALRAEGIITEVVRPLRSGKEAQIYLVLTDGGERVAKIYKAADERTFKHRSDYLEGRRGRNSRDQRAMAKHSSYGRAKDEDAWRSAEVEAIYRLRDAGVRVPEPFHFVEGVLVMELVTDAAGDPAPRLGEMAMTGAEARSVFDRLLREVVRMLCVGVVHGDLSDFNVLMATDGPVLIDFPQWVDASRNQQARDLLIRDVDNLTSFLGRFDPAACGRPYGQEIWSIYERGELTPDTVLTGEWHPDEITADTAAILREIAAVELDEQRRRIARGLPPLDVQPRAIEAQPRRIEKPSPAPPTPTPQAVPAATPRRRRRRGRRRPRGASGSGSAQAARPASVPPRV